MSTVCAIPVGNFKSPAKQQISRFQSNSGGGARCYMGIIPSSSPCDFGHVSSLSTLSSDPCLRGRPGIPTIPHSSCLETLVLMDLDPASAKLAIAFLGPFLSAFGFLFILRIVMSWYPKLPVEKFPYVVAYAPTEPLLVQTRKLIPPLGGVDVTPVVWFGLISFLNEILVGPQGLLVLLSQKV